MTAAGVAGAMLVHYLAVKAFPDRSGLGEESVGPRTGGVAESRRGLRRAFWQGAPTPRSVNSRLTMEGCQPTVDT